MIDGQSAAQQLNSIEIVLENHDDSNNTAQARDKMSTVGVLTSAVTVQGTLPVSGAGHYYRLDVPETTVLRK